jgi:hypothetical protein
MRRIARSGALALLVAVGSGCAFSNINLQLPTAPTGRWTQIGKGRTVAVVVPFTESRSIRDRCGMQKNGYNMDTADATCDQTPTDWLAQRLLSELNAAGFQATRAAETADTSQESTTVGSARVEGALLKLFVEPVIGFWSGSLEADLHASLRVTRPDGLDAEREFFSKGVLAGQMVSVTPAFESALRSATSTMMDEMVLGIAQLLDDHPQASGEPR